MISAHRKPQQLVAYIEDAEARGVGVYICGAGMAAHIAGVVAAHTTRPVDRACRSSPAACGGLDALLSMVQMPPSVPVAASP